MPRLRILVFLFGLALSSSLPFPSTALQNLSSFAWSPRRPHSLYLSSSPIPPAPDQLLLCIIHQPLSTTSFFENSSNPDFSIYSEFSSHSFREFLTSQGYSISLNPHRSRYLITSDSTISLPEVPLPASISDFFSHTTFAFYLIGDPSFSQFLRCSPSFSPAPSFRRYVVLFLFFHLITFSLSEFLNRRTVHPRLKLLHSTSSTTAAEWIDRDGLIARRVFTVCQSVLPGLSISAEATVALVDEHELDKHVFGVEPLSSYCPYDANNCTSVVKPVKLRGTVMSVILAPRDPRALYTEMYLLCDMTRVFVQSVLPKMLVQTTFPVITGFIRFWMDSWDMQGFLCYLRRDTEYELLLAEDRTDGRLVVPQEVLRQSNVNRVLSQPQVELIGGYRCLVVRTQFGDTGFLSVVAIDRERVCIPCVAEFYDRFLVIVVSLCYLIMITEDREATFKSFVHMMSVSHAFSVVETNRATGATISELGEMTKDPKERAIITEGFAAALTQADAADYQEAFGQLYRDGRGFSQKHFRLVLPDRTFRWFTVSAACESDRVYEADVICVLYEDVSNLHKLEARVQETVHDMAMASRLLALHQYAVGRDWAHAMGHEFVQELGFATAGHEVDLFALMHPHDVEMFRALTEGGTATIRLRNQLGRPKWLWYRAVCTTCVGEVRGFLFSVQESTSLESNVRATRNFFKVGSVSTPVAAWAMRLDETPGSHVVFETKSYRYLEVLVDPAFIGEVPLGMLLSLDAPVTLELKMRLLEQQPYEWHSVTLIPSQPNEVLLVACNINDQKKTRDLLRQTQDMLDLAFTYSDVRLWSFEDTHRAELAILTINTEFADEIDMDWSSLEHNVTVESQEVVKQAFRKALDRNSELEIEVPFFFDCVHWLLLRGFTVEDAGRRRLIGIHVDLTAIKEASAELQRQKAAAEDAMMAKSTFLANMTHEIRAPLGGICGLLEILSGPDLMPEQRDIVNTIQGSFTELNELLNDILDLAKLESHRLVPIAAKFDPCEVAAALDDPIFTRKAIPGVSFHIMTESGQPLFYLGDPHCYIRILTALLSNCVKFTTHGRIIIHSSCENGSSLVLTVTDSGSGMAPALLQAIQCHFLRADTAVVYEDSRVGVGLSMVTEMVRVCRATITIDSTLGVGTTVRIVFPWEPIFYPWFRHPRFPVNAALFTRNTEDRELTVDFARFYGFNMEVVRDRTGLLSRPNANVVFLECDEPEDFDWLRRNTARLKNQVIACLSVHPCSGFDRPIELFVRPLRPHLLRTYFERIACGRINTQSRFRPVDAPIPNDIGMHVLAVDDAQTNQLIIRQMLRKLGCTCRIAENGQEAVDAIRAEQFDVVLLDQSMPVLDGPQACRVIRRLGGDSSTTPIIAMTASNLQSDEEICHQAGMDAFLSKPVTLKQLAAILQAWRNRRSEFRVPPAEFCEHTDA